MNGTKQWFIDNWKWLLTITFVTISTWVTLQNTVKSTALAVADHSDKIVKLETYRAVHDNEHANLMREVREIKEILREMAKRK